MTKKRKFDEIKVPDYLPCDICKNPVYNYRFMTAPFVYCSRDCLELLVLSFKNDYLDVKPIQRAYGTDDLDEMQE